MFRKLKEGTSDVFVFFICNVKLHINIIYEIHLYVCGYVFTRVAANGICTDVENSSVLLSCHFASGPLF
jgi:hypothetical protein